MTAKKFKDNYIKTKLSLLSESEEEYKTEKVKEEDFYKYMNALHNGEGFISILTIKEEEVQRWSLNINELYKLKKLQEEENIYCSINSLYAPGKHSSKYVSKLNALIIDLDYYTIPEYRELKSFQIIELLKMDIYYLEPSFYIDSGRGLYLIWLLEDTYATQKSKKFWKQIEKTLIQIFSEFGVGK